MVLEIDSKFPTLVDLREGVSQVLLNAKDSLTETAAKAANTVTVSADRAQAALNERASKAVDAAVQAKDGLAQSAVQTVDTVTTTTGKAVNTLTETALQAGNSLQGSVEETWQKADQVSNAVSTAVENAMSALINQKLDAVNAWINAHPGISWANTALLWEINHPIISLFILLLAIFILGQFLKAFGSLVEKVFLAILQAPFRLVQFLVKASFKPFDRFRASKPKIQQPEGNVLSLMTSIPTSISLAQRERLAHILVRLEAIGQEQNNLLQEVTAILASEQPAHSNLERSSYLGQSEKN